MFLKAFTLLLTFLLMQSCESSSNSSPSPTSDTSTTDSWTQVVGDGFGDSTKNTVPEFEVFDGYLYASASPKGTGFAKLYRSSSGDSGSWVDVSPSTTGDHSIHSFATTDLGGGFIWCGTGGPNGGMIYRSQNGTTWTAIANRGFGNSALIGTTPHMVVFQGSADSQPYLYAGAISHGGSAAAQVWRIPYNSTNPADWVKLVDFANINTKVTIVSYFYVWNNKIYFGTDGGAQIWESSDGTNFTKNTGVGNGFGISSNLVIASIEVFNDYMYATTNNQVTGGQLWRSSDGATWSAVTEDAFGKGTAVIELRSIRASGSRLWLTGYTDTDSSSGTPIWRSDDGTTFTQSNKDGFGDSNNNGQNAVTIGFGNYQYFGGPNYTAGGQVWRLSQ